MRNADNAKHYFATNGTCIKVVDLGQAIALSRHSIQRAAKPSDIFLNKDNHNDTFDYTVAKYPRDMIFASNLSKAMKRGLNKYLELPTHAYSNAPSIFKKPIVRMHVYYLALLYFYQADSKWQFRADYSRSLNKNASPRLVDELHTFYQRVVTKVKTWYTEESKDLAVEVSKRKMDSFFAATATELGIDADGAVPFTTTGIDWDEYQV